MPTIISVGKAVAIMHNMATAHRRSGCLGEIRMQVAAELRQENGENAEQEDGFEKHLPSGYGVWGPPLDDYAYYGAVPGHDSGPLDERSPQYIIAAEQEATDTASYYELCAYLTELVYENRGQFLAPYLS